VLESGAKTVTYRRSELLKRPDVAPMHVEHDPSYGNRPRAYAHTVPLRALFQDFPIPAGAVLQFRCLDGFSAPLSKERLLGKDGDEAASVPYLAIEAPDEPWPRTPDNKDAGPFYLIWKDPQKSRIGTEEWPFALAGFTVKDSIEATYPKIVPGPEVAKDSRVRAGFRVFTRNCFACHTLNLQGDSHMGPDLNVPLSPTEYLAPGMLKRLVRNPQNLRHWPESKMTAFPAQAIPDAELDELTAYLKYIAKHKAPAPSSKP
jgi:mono/diheme cytochrome c family protein